MVQRAGYECDVACSGREAVEMCRRTRYSLVLMDCMLDEWMDGWTTAVKIRELNPGANTKIVALTGLAMSKDLLDKCHAAGMGDVATKPIHKDTLREWLQQMQRDGDL